MTFERKLEELYVALKELGQIPNDWTYDKMKEWIKQHARREPGPR